MALNHAVRLPDSILISYMLKPCRICTLSAAAAIRQYDQSHYLRRALTLPSLIMTFTFPRHLACRCNMIKAIICAMHVALGQLIMTSFAKLFMAPQIPSVMKLEKLKFGTDMPFTNSLNHWPHCHCAKKASIETTWEQGAILMSQLLVTGSCIDDVTIGELLLILKSSWAVTEQNLDLFYVC